MWGERTLTDRTVRTAGPGRHSDGTVRGLMLIVRNGGTRSWSCATRLAAGAGTWG